MGYHVIHTGSLLTVLLEIAAAALIIGAYAKMSPRRAHRLGAAGARVGSSAAPLRYCVARSSSRAAPCGIAATRYPELAEYARNVMLDRPVRDEQLGGDLAVGQAAGNQPQDLDLSRRQTSGVCPRRGARTAGHSLTQ